MAFFIALAIPTVVSVVRAITDSNEQQAAASRAAEVAKRDAEEKIRKEAAKANEAAEAQRRALLQQVQHQQAQLSLVEQILSGCRENRVDGLPLLLQQLDLPHFNSLENRPISAAGNEDTLVKVANMLEEERRRRGL
jgi:vacuolar-type H+-ATPase subunit E/Vma4